ncbi:helix-turn-helix domain-containing protein [Streptomonospora sp. S1-112]|uniref:Helix-turn-helix domain-containing protein n=1 Tax=Streptomonospora mangrovi TaxID=2883123 RepID=A0A9X3NW99_9ACTN|nr:helix-turn-helix domain-containing protein [Streptomonospora mangrovi]MDA0568055.1 helix-turn-helix domain-containing protein [Streptomonospora mangrovi]
MTTATADPEITVPQQLWSVQDAARFLGVPAKTLYEWRYKGDGPPSHRIGRYVRYVPAEVHAWVRTR